jgi:hypothetical protein
MECYTDVETKTEQLLGQYLDDVVSPALAAVVVVGATCLFR